MPLILLLQLFQPACVLFFSATVLLCVSFTVSTTTSMFCCFNELYCCFVSLVVLFLFCGFLAVLFFFFQDYSVFSCYVFTVVSIFCFQYICTTFYFPNYRVFSTVICNTFCFKLFFGFHNFSNCCFPIFSVSVAPWAKRRAKRK